MEHKELLLVIGLTVILAVAVSVSTVSFTGYAWKNFGTVTKVTPSAANNVVTYDGVKDVLNKAVPVTYHYIGGLKEIESCDLLCNDKRYNLAISKNKCVMAMNEKHFDTGVYGLEIVSCDYKISKGDVEKLNCLCA